MSAAIVGVWIPPTTGKRHAVIGGPVGGYRLACQPLTPVALRDADISDYRDVDVASACQNGPCRVHAANPEGPR